MGQTHLNHTMYVTHEIKKAIDEYNLNDLFPYLRFALVDNRYDEYLTEAFDLRVAPSIYVIDSKFNGKDNGTVY
jgi:hypothetical protein